jgi:hypothetical protein
MILGSDDFGIKYLKQANLDHLIASLEKYYDVTVDLEGKEYVKIELDWDYKNKRVHLSMAPYLQKALRQFDNVVPTQRQDSPYPYIKSKYGASQDQKIHVYLANIDYMKSTTTPQRAVTSLFNVRTHQKCQTLPSSTLHPTHHQISIPRHHCRVSAFHIIDVAH